MVQSSMYSKVANMEVDKVSNLIAVMVADMEVGVVVVIMVDMEGDNVPDMMLDIEVDKVADIVVFSVGHTAWAPEVNQARRRVGSSARSRAWRAHRLLVIS